MSSSKKIHSPSALIEAQSRADEKVAAWREAQTALAAAHDAAARGPVLKRTGLEHTGHSQPPSPARLVSLKLELAVIEATAALALAEHEAIRALDVCDAAQGLEADRFLPSLKSDIVELQDGVRAAEAALLAAQNALNTRVQNTFAANVAASKRRAAEGLPYAPSGFNPHDARFPSLVAQIEFCEKRLATPPDHSSLIAAVRQKIMGPAPSRRANAAENARNVLSMVRGFV
jgi:hypothetical protein